MGALAAFPCEGFNASGNNICTDLLQRLKLAKSTLSTGPKIRSSKMSDSPEAPPPDAFISTDDGLKYWEGVTADVNGMLGGFPSISRVDLQGSRAFLARLGIGSKNGRSKIARALEGGAGWVHTCLTDSQ